MHQTRRRKKRPSNGVRTIELSRGKNGFGFTISGQAPCILSCIVSNSPAEKAGLRPGDFLIAVNGLNVSKAPHDDVVRLIGNSTGILKLQIAENYYSDSSDEESVVITRPRSRPQHKPRHKNLNVLRAERVVKDLQTGSLFPEVNTGAKSSAARIAEQVNNNRALLNLILQQRIREATRSLSPLHLQQGPRHNRKQTVQKPTVEVAAEKPANLFNEPEPDPPQRNDNAALLRAVVGYLGTIELPKEPQVSGSRLQAIKSCVRRLRVEQKVHTLVMFSVMSDCVILTNLHGLMLAKFPADRITFSGVYADDRKFFGLVTRQGPPSEGSSSCHVFMVDPRLVPHSAHARRARSFQLLCTRDHRSHQCKEFPESSEPILHAIMALYRSQPGFCNRIGQDDVNPHVSPQPSNTSSNSSNSDSGIGFRDEGNTSDRVLIVDMDSYQQCFQTFSLDRQGSLPVDAPLVHSDPEVVKGNNSVDRLTVRAMPDPVGFSANTSCNTERLEAQNSAANLRHSLHKYMQLKKDLPPTKLTTVESIDAVSYKLSPKVYGIDLKTWKSDGAKLDNEEWADKTLISLDPKDDTLKDEDQGDVDLAETENGSVEVHPSTQGEDESTSVVSAQNESSCSSSKNWARSSSLRRHLGRRRSVHRSAHEAGTVSDGEVNSEKLSVTSSVLSLDQVSDSTHGSSSVSERPIDVGRVGGWAVGFDRLLQDPLGLLVFAEFLKKEFSQENIFFWVACEQYKKLKDKNERKKVAKDIYQKHLSMGALEPVNVDSHAQQVAQDGLEEASPELFVAAQKQIFNLMKFDCYQRFLKSQLFKECMINEVQGQPILPSITEENWKSLLWLQRDEMKNKMKSKNEEEKKRKSFLPWHRNLKLVSSKFGERTSWVRKSSKKKKDRSIAQNDNFSCAHSDMASSQSSLTSSETSLGLLCSQTASHESLNSCELTRTSGRESCCLCRIILPDRSTTVVRVQRGETLGSMLTQLLQKRSLNYSAVDVFVAGSDKPVNPGLDVTMVGCKEIRVEPRVVFCVTLPNNKTLGVKSDPNQSCGELLRPILAKYGLQLDHVTVRMGSGHKVLSLNTPVTEVDNQRVIIQMKETFTEDNRISTHLRHSRLLPHGESVVRRFLDAIHQGKVHFDDLGVTDLDIIFPPVAEMRQATEARNALLGLVRRNSFHTEKPRLEERQSYNGRTSVHENVGRQSHINRELANHAKKCEELFDIWARAQRLHLGDQNDNDLPDFLRLDGKENCPNTTNRPPLPGQKDKKLPSSFLDSGFGTDGVIPSQQQGQEYFSSSYGCRKSFGLNFLNESSPPRLFTAKGSRPSSHPLPRQEYLLMNGFEVPQSDDSGSPTHIPADLDDASDFPSSLDKTLSPPPLPPKAKQRGPPPRPPSRVAMYSLTSEGEHSDEDDLCLPIILKDGIPSRSDLAKLVESTKKGSSCSDNTECNISFV